MMPDGWGTMASTSGVISNLSNLGKWSDVMVSDERVPEYYPTQAYSNLTSLSDTFIFTFYDEVNQRYMNGTNATEGPDIAPLPLWRQLIWMALFAIIVVVATVGNVVVIWIVLVNKRMRTVTNYFLVSLSVADAMMSSLNVTFSFYFLLFQDWPFGDFYCRFSQFNAMLSISASVFTLMAISIDRYVAIMSPFRPRLLGKRGTLGVAAAIWVGSSLISIPNLVYLKVIYDSDTNRRICFWPDQKVDLYYNIMYMVLTYFVPIIAMTYTYARVGLKLWGSQSIGEATLPQLENARNKRRVVKMMIVVVLIFAVCWLPYHLYFVVRNIYEIDHYRYIQEVYLGIYWLAMSNSMYNPIIYCWMNSRFRRGFKQLFCCCTALGGGEIRRRRSLSPSRRNGTSTIRMSMHSTHNTMMTST